MVHSYVSEFPDVSILSGVSEFFQSFYETSDTPEAHDLYPLFFTKDATFIVANKTVRGRKGMSVLYLDHESGVVISRHNWAYLLSSTPVYTLTFKEILTARKAAWVTVSGRQHTATKIFPFGPNSPELMLYGTVVYTLNDGRKSVVDWAGRAKLVKEAAEWKLDFYQVFLDTAAAEQNAKEL